MKQDKKKQLVEDGYVILEGVFDEGETDKITGIIQRVIGGRSGTDNPKEIHAIRSVVKQNPSLKAAVLNQKMQAIME
jgi:hypothetical protein